MTPPAPRTSTHRLAPLGLALVLFAASGCLRPYTPPRPDEPHAILKLRRVYEVKSGPYLQELITIDGERVLSETVRAAPRDAARIQAILVHPRQAALGLRSRFFHTEMRMVTETYMEQESYQATETYNCGTGGTYQMCTRSVTRYRTVPKTRHVMKNVEVEDGSCATSLWIVPEVGRTYLVQMTYQDRSVCHASCVDQEAGPDGTLRNRPCPEPAAPPPRGGP